MENQTNKYKLESQSGYEKKGPLKSFKAGPIRATIWENPTNKGDFTTFKSVSLDRVYKDKQGQWQKSTVLRMGDLPKASVVLNKAYEYLITNPNQDSPETQA